MISTKDSSILALDGETGNTLSASMVHPKKPSRALFMQILCKIILTWSILFLEIDLFLSLCTMHTFQLLRLPFIDEVEEESYWTPFFWSSADGQDSSTRGSGIPNDLELGKGSNPGVDSVPKQSLVLLCSEKAAYIFSFVHAVQVAINCRHPIEPFFYVIWDYHCYCSFFSGNQEGSLQEEVSLDMLLGINLLQWNRCWPLACFFHWENWNKVMVASFAHI